MRQLRLAQPYAKNIDIQSVDTTSSYGEVATITAYPMTENGTLSLNRMVEFDINSINKENYEDCEHCREFNACTDCDYCSACQESCSSCEHSIDIIVPIEISEEAQLGSLTRMAPLILILFSLRNLPPKHRRINNSIKSFPE